MLLVIRNARDLRTYYYQLKLLENYKIPAVSNLIIEYKKAIRNYNKARDLAINGSHIIRDYGIDGFIDLVKFPDYIKSYEQAEEYFNEYLYLQCSYSAYDCSGESFTSWYKIIYRNNSYWVYHSIGFNI